MRPDAATLTAKSCASVNPPWRAPSRIRPAVAIPAKARRSDQIVASQVRAQTFSDIAGKRSDGIGAHELGEKGEFASLFRGLRGGASRRVGRIVV